MKIRYLQVWLPGDTSAYEYGWEYQETLITPLGFFAVLTSKADEPKP
jgi:hypothetical protein